MKATLSSINSATIGSAGARYTPAVEAGAPNLVIEPSVELIEVLSLNDAFRERLRKMADLVDGAADRYSKSLVKGFQRRKQTPNELARLLRQLADQKPGTSKKTTNAIVRTLQFCRKRTGEIERGLYSEGRDAEENSEEGQRISAEQSYVRRLSGVLYDIGDFVNSAAFKCVSNNKLLFLGEWGTGKTHFLCDITRIRDGQNLATLTVLAHKLSRKSNPLEAVCRLIPSASQRRPVARQTRSIGQEAQWPSTDNL